MSNPSYSELLKHPLWQKKRLEILELHGFECEFCRNKESTLHVHHGYYEKGRMPWDYENGSLHCLCTDCHTRLEQKLNLLRKVIGCLDDEASVDMILGYALASFMAAHPRIWVSILTRDVAWGMADYFKISADDIVNVAEKADQGIGLVNGVQLSGEPVSGKD